MAHFVTLCCPQFVPLAFTGTTAASPALSVCTAAGLVTTCQDTATACLDSLVLSATKVLSPRPPNAISFPKFLCL